MHTLSRSASSLNEPNFAEVPFKTLSVCHADIAMMLDEMNELADLLGRERLSGVMMEKARAAHLFFSGHAIEHHLDEERHVFPALLAAGKPEWIGMVRKLQLDHALLEARWMKLGPLLHLLARGYYSQPERLQDELRIFVEIYRQHMALEDSFAYPCARQQLNVEAVCTMNREMAHRRVKDEAADDQDDGWV
ncbi:MAG: hypothetical protein C0487_06510 [Leptothrix sp. (in: Bacteria)]|nr:hypothetical protein [Leptothrix sp. (in: b-proteobacteria)]